MSSCIQIQDLPITLLSCDPVERQIGEQLLRQCFEETSFSLDESLKQSDSLPILWVKPHLDTGVFQLGIYCLGPFRQRFFKYFYEFCFNTCLQRYEPDPLTCIAIDFFSQHHPNYPRLTLCRIQMQLRSQEEIEWLAQTLMQSKEQIRTGIWTGSSSDWSVWQQMAAEDEKITRVAKRWADLSQRMHPELAKVASEKLHQLIANLSKKILADRSIKHVLHIACAMALPIWRQNSHLKSKERSAKRKAWISHSQRWVFSNDKRQLMDCYTITLNYLRSHETLDERHILQALRKHCGISTSSAHFFTNLKDSNTKFHHFYLEIPFEYAAVSQSPHSHAIPSLKNFDERILSCIERKQLRIFQPRNDEESFKRLVNLAKEVQSELDIAQVALSFDEQTDERLVFCLLIARPLLQEVPGQEFCDQTIGNDLSIKVEKKRKIEEGSIVKELIMARAEVLKAPFVREDYSVDLHRCRLFIMRQLISVLGAIRDYNGGLIAKQHQLFEEILEKLGPIPTHQQMLVEEVFFALQPSVATASFEIETLSNFFAHILRSESTRKQELKALRLDWKNQGELVFLAALSSEAESLQSLTNYFQEKLFEGASLVYAQLQQPYYFLQVALIKLDEENGAKLLKSKIRKFLTSKGIAFQLREASKNP